MIMPAWIDAVRFVHMLVAQRIDGADEGMTQDERTENYVRVGNEVVDEDICINP